MPLVILFFGAAIGAIVLLFGAGITGLPASHYNLVSEQRAIAEYRQTGTAPASVDVIGRTLGVDTATVINSPEVARDKSESHYGDKRFLAHIEQAIIDTCISVHARCGLLSRTSPDYDSIRLSAYSNSYDVRKMSDNDFLRFDSLELISTHNPTPPQVAQTYYGIWQGNYTIEGDDVLVYDLYVPSTGMPSPATSTYAGGVDLEFTGGTSAKMFPVADTDGRHITYYQPPVKDQWIERKVPLRPVTGSKIKFVDLVIEGMDSGNFTMYFRSMRIENRGRLKLRIWDPSYVWAFLPVTQGDFATVLADTTDPSINCASADEEDYAEFGRYMIAEALPPGVDYSRFIYDRPEGGYGCSYADIISYQ